MCLINHYDLHDYKMSGVWNIYLKMCLICITKEKKIIYAAYIKNVFFLSYECSVLPRKFLLGSIGIKHHAELAK